MPTESASVEQVGSSSDSAATSVKSTIQSPYLDLENAVEIAKAVRSLGGDSCDLKQLAVKLGVAADGGGFRMRLLAAKTFGLIAYTRGAIQLTALGARINDPVTEKRARFDAFMAVPLYSKLFERLEGQPLPPPAAIELMMERLGVGPQLKEKARQVFNRSARNAGLLELASDRLSTPPGLDNTPRTENAADQARGKKRGGDEPPLHPFIDGLIRTLPQTETEWPIKARAKWLQAAANIFDLIYLDAQAPETGSIKISIEKGEAVNA